MIRNGKELRAWRNRLGLSQEQAAQAMRMTDRMFYNYESGRKPIPRRVKLACVALEDHPELRESGHA